MNKFTAKIINEHKTNDPFVIAKNLGVKIIEEPLGKINGYYDGFIHINSDLPKWHKYHVAAHHLFTALTEKEPSFLIYKERLTEEDLCKLQNSFSTYLFNNDIETYDDFLKSIEGFDISIEQAPTLFARMKYIKSLKGSL